MHTNKQGKKKKNYAIKCYNNFLINSDDIDDDEDDDDDVDDGYYYDNTKYAKYDRKIKNQSFKNQSFEINHIRHITTKY